MSQVPDGNQQRRLLLRILDEAFDKKAWHGPNLLGSIRRVPATLAVRRPGRGRHNIAGITVHCAYWKYAIRRRIRGDKRGSFTLKGSNWFDLSSRLTDTQWRGYVALVREEHAALRETLASTPWRALVKAFGGEPKFLEQAYGIAMHDTYHAGQIQTLKAILKRSTPSH
ncbi:MAG: DinB family protein [Planctomycetes bacterium]|nr:DinB family protein [Planctomycetota bacterium]